MERPILFSAPMVRAILEGRKTQTRRVVKRVPDWCESWGYTCFTPKGCISARGPVSEDHGDRDNYGEKFFRLQYGAPGDLLWVRETWAGGITGGSPSVDYRADGKEYGNDCDGVPLIRWRPSIHMPRWASRITLKVTEVRVEKLTHITYADSKAEGLSFVGDGGARYGIPGMPSTWNDNPRASYQALWESINGAESWAANPWVWVVSFERQS